MKRTRKPVEAVSGSYTPMPHAVLDSAAFTGASIRAKAMLLEFIRQHNGRNNGRFQATTGWLKGRGWTSKEAIQLAVSELIERGLVVMTKRGGLNIGPSYYALTWLQISDFGGLDINPKSYWPGAWTMCSAPPVKKHERRPATRGSTAPPDGAEDALTAPPHGAKTAFHGGFTAPPHGNNECCQFPADRIRAVLAKEEATTTKRSVRTAASSSRAPWMPAYLDNIESVGLAGRQCFQIPEGVTLQ